MRMYVKFAAMIATATVVMYGLMYLNNFALAHVRYSQTRVWMALLMGAVMATIMLAYMFQMVTPGLRGTSKGGRDSGHSGVRRPFGDK